MKLQTFILYKVTTFYDKGDTRITNAAVPSPENLDTTYDYTSGAELVRKRILSSSAHVLRSIIENVGMVEVITD